MIDFSKYDKSIDKDELKEQLEQAQNNTPIDYPDGIYEVSLDQMEMRETNDGKKLMISIRWNINAGKYNGRKIFQNLVVSGTTNDGFVIWKAMEFLRSLGVEEEDCHFTTYSALASLVSDLNEDFKGEEYELSLTTDKKGYKQYTIE